MSYALSILIALIHLAFIVYVMGGGMLWLYWRRAWIIHLIATAWGAAVMLFNWTCPLTPLENYLRKQSGAEGYEGGFIEH